MTGVASLDTLMIRFLDRTLVPTDLYPNWLFRKLEGKTMTEPGEPIIAASTSDPWTITGSGFKSNALSFNSPQGLPPFAERRRIWTSSSGWSARSRTSG